MGPRPSPASPSPVVTTNETLPLILVGEVYDPSNSQTLSLALPQAARLEGGHLDLDSASNGRWALQVTCSTNGTACPVANATGPPPLHAAFGPLDAGTAVRLVLQVHYLGAGPQNPAFNNAYDYRITGSLDLQSPEPVLRHERRPVHVTGSAGVCPDPSCLHQFPAGNRTLLGVFTGPLSLDLNATWSAPTPASATMTLEVDCTVSSRQSCVDTEGDGGSLVLANATGSSPLRLHTGDLPVAWGGRLELWMKVDESGLAPQPFQVDGTVSYDAPSP